MAKFNIKWEADAKSLVKLEGISKKYGKKVIFENVNLEIKAGDRIGLLGHNGSGKTTLVEIISNLKRATEGKVTYQGINSNSMGKLVSTQHQDLTYPEGYKVIEILKFFASINAKNVKEATKTLNQFIEVFDMGHIVGKKLNALSGGEMQRVNLVIALMDRSQILILDEIATGLDAAIYDQALNFIEDYIKVNNMALILISHKYAEIARFAKEVYVIKDKVLHPAQKIGKFKTSDFEEGIDQNKGRDVNKITVKRNWDFENMKLRTFGRKMKQKFDSSNTSKLPEAKIEIKNVSKKFGTKYAIKNINFEIEQGERLAILGGNGAGKTTLMEIIAKVQKPTSGKINYWWGAKNWEVTAGIGMQFQQSLFPGDLKVWEVVEQFARSSEYALKWKEIAALAESFNLGEVWKQSANALSGGQKQKLNILIALLKKPKVIILDEISTGLDVISQKEIISFIDNYVRENNLTLIVISHIPMEIVALSEKAIIMKRGETTGQKFSIKKLTEEKIKKILVASADQDSEKDITTEFTKVVSEKVTAKKAVEAKTTPAKKAAPKAKSTVKKPAAKKVVAKKPTKTIDYNSKTVVELKEMAKKSKITGLSSMKKADLIKALKGVNK